MIRKLFEVTRRVYKHARNICYGRYGDYCRFCNGSGMTECLKCKYNPIHEKGKKMTQPFNIATQYKRWEKCEKCSKGWVECIFCGGNGRSHQIF